MRNKFNKLLILLASATMTFSTLAVADYYAASGIPVQRSAISSAQFRTEFSSIETNISDKLPAYSSNGDNFVVVNAGGTALTSITVVAARVAMDILIGTNVQAWDVDLDELRVLANTDSNFIVGNGSIWVAETGTTARTSLGVGTGDSPHFTAINIGHASDTTIQRTGSGVINVEGNTVWTAGNLVYLEGSFTVSYDAACTTTPTQIWHYVKIGDMVTITPDDAGFTCTSDSADFRDTGFTMPSAIRPNTNVHVYASVVNNGTKEFGCVKIAQTGGISIHKMFSVCSQSWADSGVKSAFIPTFSYSAAN